MHLGTNNHSVFSLNYHLVVVTKYRRRVISMAVLETIRVMAADIGKIYNVAVAEFNGEDDHVHMLLRTKPNCDLSKYIAALKGASSRIIKQRHPEVCEKLYDEAFWSPSYCLLTVGGAPLEVLKGYIEDQARPGK